MLWPSDLGTTWPNAPKTNVFTRSDVKIPRFFLDRGARVCTTWVGYVHGRSQATQINHKYSNRAQDARHRRYDATLSSVRLDAQTRAVRLDARSMCKSMIKVGLAKLKPL